MQRQKMHRDIREGLRLIEAAYKEEIKIARKDGIASKADHERAAAFYYRGNKLISEVLDELYDSREGLPGKIGGNIRV